MTPRELLPPAELGLEEAVQALESALSLSQDAAQETERSFFDTFDGRVRAAGLLVVHDQPAGPGPGPGRLRLLERKHGTEQAAAPLALPGATLGVGALPAGPLRDALAGVLEVRVLLPLAHVHLRERTLRVLDDERKTVARIAVQEPTLVSPGGWRSPLRPRLRLTAVRGYDEQLEHVATSLGELGFAAPDRPLVDEAVLAAGGEPGGISTKVDVKLSASGRADAAAAAVLRRLAEVIEANVEGTIADLDAEFLHDLRVAVRRSRAVQRELRGVFGAERLQHFRGEFRWLQQITGDSRDLDVYVLDFADMRAMVPQAMQDDLDPVLRVLRGRRVIAHREMVRELRSDRAVRALREWDVFLEELVTLPDDDRPEASRAIGELSGQRIRKVYRKMVKMGSEIGPESPPEAYHELRKKGKELRYLLELFGAPLYPDDVVRPMVKALKALQDVLGRHQDREIQVASLRALATEVSAVRGGAAALMAMGVLIERLGEDEQAARDEFSEHFAAFAAKPQRRRVKETFK